MKLRPWSQSLALACILALSLLIFPHPLEAAPDSAGAVPTALVYFDDSSPDRIVLGNSYYGTWSAYRVEYYRARQRANVFLPILLE